MNRKEFLMQKYEEIKRSRKEIMINNFLGGIAWGLGATIGVSIILAVLGFIAGNANLIPIVGTFVSQIVYVVLKTNQHFK